MAAIATAVDEGVGTGGRPPLSTVLYLNGPMMLTVLFALSLVLCACQVLVLPEQAERPSAQVRGVVAASGAYFMAHALLVLIGLVSMPIMTRLLSKAEYGLLSLIFATVSVLAVVGGLGFGEAVVRLYDEHRLDGVEALRRLCDSLLGGALAMGAIVGLAIVLFAIAVPGISSGYGRGLVIAGALIVVRVVSGVLYQIYRAQQRAIAHAATQVS